MTQLRLPLNWEGAWLRIGWFIVKFVVGKFAAAGYGSGPRQTVHPSLALAHPVR